MRWILMAALVLPCAIIGCNTMDDSSNEATNYETVSLSISGMT